MALATRVPIMSVYSRSVFNIWLGWKDRVPTSLMLFDNLIANQLIALEIRNDLPGI